MEKLIAPKIEISVKTILVGIGVFFFLKFAWDMKDLFLSLFIAYIVMSAAKQPVEMLVKKGVSRRLAVLLVFALFFIGLGLVFSSIIPPLVSETTLFIKHFPQIVENVRATSPINFGSFSIIEYIPNVTNRFIIVLGSLFSNASFFISTLFFSIYLTFDSNLITIVLSRFVSKQQLERIVSVEAEIEKRLGKWLLGQIFLMTIIGVTTYITLLLLGVKYALPLGIIAGLLEAIPNIGPTVAAIPAFLVGFSQYPLLGLFTVLSSISIQQFENQIVVPMVMKKVVGIHPILTLIVLIIGGRYAGVLGLLFAIPLSLVVGTIITEIRK
jgi:predicted PurR-regulated permease PerM